MLLNFLLFEPDEKHEYYSGINQGVAILIQIAKDNGHETKVYSLDPKKLDILEDIELELNSYFLISTYSFARDTIKKAIAVLNKRGFMNVILGGPHFTFAPEDFYDVDFLWGIRGEAELIFEDFLNWRIDITTKGVVYRENDTYVDNGIADPIEEIERFKPFIYKELQGKAKNLIGAEILTSRGCPYSCSYCLNSAYNNEYGRCLLRRKSPEKVINEILDYPYEYDIVGFHDDVFSLDKDWLKEFLSLYKRFINKRFWCNIHVLSIDQEIVNMLKEGGCERVHIGVESGSEKIRHLMKREHMTNSDIISVFDMFRQSKIKTVSFNIIGFPGETEEDIKKTIELNKEIRPDWILVSRFQAYPGTDYYKKESEFLQNYYKSNGNDLYSKYHDDFVSLVRAK
ncbi:MAG: hypothetical protein C0601_10885 [Candidatus Muiribacterium halophilum]|uniref:Radical SAM core domain-containing protein n=1 Tax=Muiribacterium halophilum TaxID=2053465 RepID=A0A2N5ZBR2_MUIH1|nr:MAG: hypothetical protein C0601_10885 [Candidatus Muirbacterium halophilum]